LIEGLLFRDLGRRSRDLKLGWGGAEAFSDVTFDCFSEGRALGEGSEGEGDLGVDNAVAVAVLGAKEGVDVLPELGNGGDYEGGAVVDAGVAAILYSIEVAAGRAGAGSRSATGHGVTSLSEIRGQGSVVQG
jgi:hypothetical protein